jgi:threonine/homoserine/homoserine lactone efflux protein
MDIQLFIIFILLESLLVLCPGPKAAFTLAQALQLGPRKALFAPAGFALTRAVHAIMIFCGVEAVKDSALFVCCKWVGSLYLFRLAYLMLRKRASGPEPARSPHRHVDICGRAFVLSVLNPQNLAVDAAILPLFIDSSQALFPQAVLLTLTAMFLSFAGYACYVVWAAKLFLRQSLLHLLTGFLYVVAGGVLLAT